MSDPDEEHTLREIGQMLREDPRLERLALGELDSDEQARLEADARRNPDLAADVELYRPLSENMRAKLAASVRPGLQTPRRRRVFIPAATTALAAAAALLFFVRMPAPIPSYALNFRAGDASLRGAPPPTESRPQVREDSPVSIVLQPFETAAGPLEGQLYVIEDGQPRLVTAPPERSPDGAIRFQGTAVELSDGRRGVVRWVAVVSRPGVDPPPSAFAADQAGTHGRGWHSEQLEVLIMPLASP